MQTKRRSSGAKDGRKQQLIDVKSQPNDKKNKINGMCHSPLSNFMNGSRVQDTWVGEDVRWYVQSKMPMPAFVPEGIKP